VKRGITAEEHAKFAPYSDKHIHKEYLNTGNYKNLGPIPTRSKYIVESVAKAIRLGTREIN